MFTKVQAGIKAWLQPKLIIQKTIFFPQTLAPRFSFLQKSVFFEGLAQE